MKHLLMKHLLVSVDGEVVKAVDKVVNMPEAPNGYVDMLMALSVLMSENPNEEAQKAGRTIAALAEVLYEYLGNEDEEMDSLMVGNPVRIRLRDTELEIVYEKSINNLFDELMRLIECKVTPLVALKQFLCVKGLS